jgi:hypothetical protein
MFLYCTGNNMRIWNRYDVNEQRESQRMLLSGMLRCVALVKTDVSEELIAFIIRVKRFSELRTKLGITSK